MYSPGTYVSLTLHQRLRLLLLTGLLCLVGTALFGKPAAAQQSELTFQQYAVKSGLAHSNTTVVMQDRKGFIWVGTERGLSRYDGTQFKNYRNDPTDNNSLYDHFVVSLAEGKAGEIWVASREALSRFDPEQEQFVSFLINDDDETALHGYILDMLVDQKGDVWLAMDNGGVSRYDVAEGRFEHLREFESIVLPDTSSKPLFVSLTEGEDGEIWVGLQEGGVVRIQPETGSTEQFAPGDESGAEGLKTSVQALHTDDAGVIWAGTETGLMRYEATLGRFTDVPLSFNREVELDVWTIAGGSAGSLWLGTGESGLLRVDPSSGQTMVYQNRIDKAGTIASNQIRSIVEDQTGGVWAATNNAISYADLNRKPFQNYVHNPNLITSLSSQEVFGIAQQQDGTLWVASINGLNQRLPGEENFIRYFHDARDAGSIAGNEVWSVFVDHRDDVWLSAFGYGINRLKKGAYSFTHYPPSPDDTTAFQGIVAFLFYEDSQQRLWIGSELGLHLFDRATDSFKLFEPPGAGDGSSVRAILEESGGRLLIGTGLSGLYVFDIESEQFTHHFLPDDTQPNALMSKNVLMLYEDSHGTIWAGTDKGLHQVIEDEQGLPSGAFRLYLDKDGLVDNGVVGMLEDPLGRLWISTSAGLSRASRIARRDDPGQFRLSFKNYDMHDGLPGNTFYIGPALKGNGGLFYFGGDSGFIEFDPLAIKDNQTAPEVTISDIQRFNESLKPGEVDEAGRVLLDVAPPYADTLHLTHEDRVISISFSALHYAAPETNLFQYRLRGFEELWTAAGDQRQATYTNLPAGTYTFEVMAANGDGIWNEEPATLTIHVAPPFWKTLWFRLLVTLLGAVSIVGFYMSRTRNIRQRNQLLESRVAARTEELREKNTLLQQSNAELVSTNEALHTTNKNLAQASKELRDALERNKEILGITAHDLKNPLGGVIGLADIILDDANMLAADDYKVETIANVRMLKDEMEGMLQNVRDLLDRYRDDYNEKLHIEALDLREAVHHVLRWNSKSAIGKGIEIKFDCPRMVEAHVDRTAIQRVMDNLVSNAVKYTMPQTTVCVKLEKEDERIRFSVCDNGPGLTGEDKAKAFKKMQRLSAKPTGGEHSTGLGLYIVKKLVEMHGGRVGVDSEFGQGATFWFDVPVQHNVAPVTTP